jgi:GTP-binding protein YchF
MLRAGIVGLPNVGKSTLFNALTRTRKAEAANYPFCTIEPNVGVVVVPDARMGPLARIAKTTRIVPAAIEFVDIAGPRGFKADYSHKLTDAIGRPAIVEVVRCFESKDIVHVSGHLDPVADMETIKTELVLADLETLARSREKLEKLARGGDKEAQVSLAVSDKLVQHLDTGRRALTLAPCPDEQAVARKFFLLTSKPILFTANVAEDDLANAASSPRVAAVRHYAETHAGTEAVVVSAEIESQLAELPEEEAREYLSHLGVAESGVGSLIRPPITSSVFLLTAGDKEVRAWTIHAGDTARPPQGDSFRFRKRLHQSGDRFLHEDLVAVIDDRREREGLVNGRPHYAFRTETHPLQIQRVRGPHPHSRY